MNISPTQPNSIVQRAVDVVPSPRQLAWQETEFYAFIHFNMNAWTGLEWGTGKEDPALFNPTEFDAELAAKKMITKLFGTQKCDHYIAAESKKSDAGRKPQALCFSFRFSFCLIYQVWTCVSRLSSAYIDGRTGLLLRFQLIREELPLETLLTWRISRRRRADIQTSQQNLLGCDSIGLSTETDPAVAMSSSASTKSQTLSPH